MERKSRKMGFVNFTSHKAELPVSAGTVFEFISDLNNFREMMPEQVFNITSSTDDFEFDIKGMAHISLIKATVVPGRSVQIISKPENPIELKLRSDIESTGQNSSSVVLELSADLSPMLKLMASGPLQNLINIMADKLKEKWTKGGH